MQEKKKPNKIVCNIDVILNQSLDSLLDHVQHQICCKKSVEKSLTILKEKYLKPGLENETIFSNSANTIRRRVPEENQYCLGNHPKFN